MNRKALDMTNVTILKPSPILELEALYEEFKSWPHHLGTARAANLMGVSPQGAAKMHSTIERLSAGKDDAGHLIFRKDIAIALRWARCLRGGDNDNAPGPHWE